MTRGLYPENGNGQHPAREVAGNGESPRTFRQLMQMHPRLRPPVIHGLLRRGETMNLIAPPKTGKSWLVTDLAIAVATGRSWLGRFATMAGDVLILDNELHGETTADRVPRVAQARGVEVDAFADRVWVHNLRGQLRSVLDLGAYLEDFPAGTFRLVVLDAFYRFMPPETDENDNGTVAQLYSHLDAVGDKAGVSFCLVHHSTKGNQSAKAVTDVGAGAGSQSRATDTHVILRQHAADGCVVMDAAARSWPPMEPICLRWRFPVWHPADDLDPAELRRDGRQRKPKAEKPVKPVKAEWTVDAFVKAFIPADPVDKGAVVAKARLAKVPAGLVNPLISAAIAEKAAFEHPGTNGRVRLLATRPVPAKVPNDDISHTHAPPTPPTGA